MPARPQNVAQSAQSRRVRSSFFCRRLERALSAVSVDDPLHLGTVECLATDLSAAHSNCPASLAGGITASREPLGDLERATYLLRSVLRPVVPGASNLHMYHIGSIIVSTAREQVRTKTALVQRSPMAKA